MRIKRFVGDSVSEAMGKVKRELGADAVILQTRNFREGGFLGLFGKVKVEITAAIEEQPVTKKVPLPPTNAHMLNQNRMQKQGEYGVETAGHAVATASLERLSNPRQTGPLEAELQTMRRMLEKMNQQMEGMDGEQGIWPVPLQKWADRLKDRGVSPKLVKKLLRTIQQKVREEDWTEDDRVIACLKSEIQGLCSPTSAIQPGVGKPRVVALIGPTGVGKTTTIGKLAAGFSIVDKRRVALITADTYRVAAVEQLKTFGEIIGVPVDVVMTPSELENAIVRHGDKELIFIDTAGRSPHHDLHMSELRAFIEKVHPDFTFLVMSATTHSADQVKIFNRFEPFTTHLVFTKLDETVNGGALLNLISRTNLPIAYITHGQNVPDDIEAATPEALTRYIFGEENGHE